MQWTGLWVQNFLSITEAHLEMDNQGLVLIEGKNLTSNKFKSNGSGKTSLLEAITYVIYDLTSKGLKADDVINNKVKKNTAVILEGKKGEDVYRIERYRKHTKNKNKVKLFCNDQEITGKSAAETNRMIEQIVGMDYNTFVNSIMFSQGNGAGRFALATDKEKKEILEGLVNMVIYTTSQNVAKDRVKSKDAEIMEKKREGERLNWELAQVDTLEQQDKQNYENTLNLIKQQRETMQKLTEDFDYYARHNFAPTEALKEEIEQLKAKAENMITTDITPYLNEYNIANQALREYGDAGKRLDAQKADLVNKYKQVQMSTNCPVCGGDLDPVHREQEMASIKEQLRQVLLQIQTVTSEIPKAQAKWEEAQKVYLEQKALSDSAMGAYRMVMGDIQAKENAVNNYNAAIQNYKDRISQTKAYLEQLSSLPEPKPREKEREAIRGKIQAQKEQLVALEKEKTALETAVKVFSNSGVKSHVLDLITPFLNTRGNEYLAILSGPDMELQFSTQTKNKDNTLSDKFDIKILNKAGGDEYKAQSEGEKKRADLSIALALQDLVMSRGDSSTNFIVYDEVFDALDEVGCENVVTLLRERQKMIGTIYVITHAEHLKPLFQKKITVVKDKNGESKIREDETT